MKIHLNILALLVMSTVAHADDYALIHHVKSPGAQVSVAQVRAIYTGKTKLFGNDVAVVVVPTDDMPAFAVFVDRVFSTTTKTLLSKIKQEVFKGDMAKPLKAATDEEVIRHVAGTAGAVGVIAPAAAKNLPSTVAVLPIGG